MRRTRYNLTHTTIAVLTTWRTRLMPHGAAVSVVTRSARVGRLVRFCSIRRLRIVTVSVLLGRPALLLLWVPIHLGRIKSLVYILSLLATIEGGRTGFKEVAQETSSSARGLRWSLWA